MHISKILLNVLIVVANSAAYAADSVKVLVGDKVLLLPIPAGFVDPKDTAPVLHSRAERLTPPQMKLLAVYVAESDISAARTGTVPKFESYFMAQVLRGKEGETVDLKAFAAVKSQVRGAPKVEDQKQVRAEVQRHISSAAREIGSSSKHAELALKIGESRQLGIFNETERSLSMLVVSDVEGANGARKYAAVMAQATSFVLLRGKVILFTAYKKIEGDADYSLLRKQCESWVQSAVEENSN